MRFLEERLFSTYNILVFLRYEKKRNYLYADLESVQTLSLYDPLENTEEMLDQFSQRLENWSNKSK